MHARVIAFKGCFAVLGRYPDFLNKLHGLLVGVGEIVRFPHGARHDIFVSEPIGPPDGRIVVRLAV
jgi:hypothetical protein